MATWEIDSSHTSVGFSVRHLVIAKVRGHFGKFSGRIETTGETLEGARISGTIEVASIHTADEKRDGHLRSPDFFDAEKYPTITFESTKIERAGDRLKATGNITIRGVTKPVTLEVEEAGRARDPWGGERMVLSAHGSLDRKDFGLNWNQALETGGVLVGEKVELNLEVEAVRKS